MKRMALLLALAVSCTSASSGLSITRLYVRTQPPGAQVVVDSQTFGVSPRLLQVSPGGHVVKLVLKGYVTEQRRIDVPAMQITRLVVKLQKQPTPRTKPTAAPGKPTKTTPPVAAPAKRDGQPARSGATTRPGTVDARVVISLKKKSLSLRAPQSGWPFGPDCEFKLAFENKSFDRNEASVVCRLTGTARDNKKSFETCCIHKVKLSRGKGEVTVHLNTPEALDSHMSGAKMILEIRLVEALNLGTPNMVSLLAGAPIYIKRAPKSSKQVSNLISVPLKY